MANKNFDKIDVSKGNENIHNFDTCNVSDLTLSNVKSNDANPDFLIHSEKVKGIYGINSKRQEDYDNDNNSCQFRSKKVKKIVKCRP